MKQKWYLQTWLIAILFAFWFFIIPGIAGIVLLVLQYADNRKISQRLQDEFQQRDAELKKAYTNLQKAVSEIDSLKEIEKAYNGIQSMNKKINDLEAEFSTKKEYLESDYSSKLEKLELLYANRLQKLDEDYKEKHSEYTEKLKSEFSSLTAEHRNLSDEIGKLKIELDQIHNEITIANYDFSDYDGISSEECKNKLAILKQKSKDLIKNDNALYITSYASKKEINDNKKQIIRCFNAECDNILVNLSVKNIDTSRKKVTGSFEYLNKIFKVDGIQMNHEMLELKLEELNLVYTYELKREQEKEQQKAIKAQMLEEEKLRREIEIEKKKIEKDQSQFSAEVKRLIKYMQNAKNDAEKELYIDKIKELEIKLKELEAEKEHVLNREAKAKAGYVYIISNIGSFGENIYKIGMTRRLEPMDRIKELSSASVPFEFDVHAMIFSENAPELENMLHTHFKKYSVNKVNFKKEFFRISIDEIETYVKKELNNTVEFRKIPVAKEYKETLIIERELA